MQLTLRRPRADSTPTDQICNVLRANRIEQFGANRDTKVSEVTEKLTSNSKSFVDVEGSVEVRVVDETFPAYCCSWFLIGESGVSWWEK